MHAKTISYFYGVFVIILITINCIYADIDDNEVNDIPSYYMLQGVKIYQGDSHCALLGGLCVHSSDCNEPTSNKGLCPSNAHRGVECCYELPMRPAPCEQHLGECMDRCHKTLMRPGTDCQNGQVCCVLV